MTGVRLSPHRVSTAHLQAAYPFVSEGGLGGQGAYIGREALGGTFCYDPFVLYANGVITNPNMLIAGQVGRGKSSFVKTYLWRQQVFGRRAWIVDPKGEYGPLAAACGVTPIRLGPGSAVRLNPLDAGAGAAELDATEILRRRVTLLGSLVASSLHRPLGPEEQSALDLAVRAASRATQGAPTLPDVVTALLHPTDDAATEIATTVDELAGSARKVALELRRLCHGDLAGMFDGPTTPGLDLDAHMVVLDLSALYSSDALGLLMLCATAWLQASLTRAEAGQRIIVVDEAWAILRDVQIARWLQASYKLCRSYGVANIAVFHRLSDLRAVGAAGSEQARLAEGLLSDSETQVFYHQPADVIRASRDLMELTDAEADTLRRLGLGESLWRVGARSFHVMHVLGAGERALVDTDARMG
jgi:type IV secretory pathway VirB4 component